MTRLHVCSPKSFDERESGACLKASARNWFRVRYEEKKIYICYVLYMVCIVFVKMTQTMFYRNTFLYEDV